MKKLHECISEQIAIDASALDVIVSKFEIRQLKKGGLSTKTGAKLTRDVVHRFGLPSYV